MDQIGVARAEYIESREGLLDYLVGGLGMKRIGDNQWARGSKRRIVLAEFKEWSDAHKMAAQITYTSASLKA